MDTTLRLPIADFGDSMSEMPVIPATIGEIWMVLYLLTIGGRTTTDSRRLEESIPRIG